MTLALRYAARSDVGLRREGNEDSAYAGPHLLAVADGMGGHAAGEVASATVISTVAELDAEHAPDDLPGVIHGAVASCSRALRELIRADPSRQGMGTTLTALLWTDDGHVGVGHIGDSRAYLLRDGQFYQVTRDHTKVQMLLERGEITEAELETHPQRSVLVRALDGMHPVRADVSVHEALPDDRYLLCSDGLSGVAPERAIFQTLRSVPDPDAAALRLIEIACRGGGPDNITCIVADVIDTAVSHELPTRTTTFAGAAAESESGEPPVSRPDDPRDPELTGVMPIPAAAAPQPEPAPEPRPEPAPERPDETGPLRDDISGLGDRVTGLHERVAELEADRDRHDSRIADLSGEAAEARSEMQELRDALAERGKADGTRSMALAAQMRELKKLKADFLSLREDVRGGDIPSARITVRLRDPDTPPEAREWPAPPELEDDPAPAGSTTMSGYTPTFAGYSGIGAGLLARASSGTAPRNDDEDKTEGDTSDQPWG